MRLALRFALLKFFFFMLIGLILSLFEFWQKFETTNNVRLQLCSNVCDRVSMETYWMTIKAIPQYMSSISVESIK